MTRKYVLSDLTNSELEALTAYKLANGEEFNGDSPCFELNRELRNGIWPHELKNGLQRIVGALDGVFSRGPRLEEAITVYRGIGHRKHLPLHEIGKRFRSNEFWSTSISDQRLGRFMIPESKPGKGAILTLKLPQGFPVYDMETLGPNGDEEEYLLPRCVLWTVQGFSIMAQSDVEMPLNTYFDQIVSVVLTAENWVPPSF